MPVLNGKTILLIISGGIAAYKSLELIRLLRKDGANVRCILTKGGAEFITPLSVSSLSEHAVYTDLFSLKDESEMGHIRLSREADLIIVAPASANMIAKMAHGMADDLASTTLLASDKPIMIAPAMNHMMWANPATQDNIKALETRGISQIGPASGDMACGETGMGRMVEPDTILDAVRDFFLNKPLKGVKAIVTSGPTFEPIDPVRFIGNKSSGKQGHAIATALIQAGAEVEYITGPTNLPPPQGAHTTTIDSAQEMINTVESCLPADIFIGVAAVCDWRSAEQHAQKMKKGDHASPPTLSLIENPDILQNVATHKKRPKLVIGFAAETQNLKENARAKLERKKCDWIVGNTVSGEETAFGSDENQVCLLKYTQDRQDITLDEWARMSKTDIAHKLVDMIAEEKGIRA